MKNLVLIILIFSMFVGNIYTQDVPRVISYQGVLVGADGKPVNAEKLIIKFTFYDTEQNGNPIGTLKDRELKVQGGLFFTLLGNEPEDDLPSFDRPTWLEVETQGNRFRVQMTAAVYALNIPDNLVTSLKIKDGEVKAIDIGDNEVVKSIKGLKEAIDIVAGNPNIRIKVDGQNIVIEGKDTVKAAEHLIGGIPAGVPVGTVLPYMGDGSDLTALEADGWYLCDGRLISDLSGLTADKKNTLQQLFSRAGNPSPGNLPDLRGYFLRGADRGQGKDLDFGGRLGNGEKIGSVQGDEIKKHKHVWPYYYYGQGPNNSMVYPSMINHGQPQNAPKNPEATSAPDFGGSETRPKNV